MTIPIVARYIESRGEGLLVGGKAPDRSQRSDGLHKITVFPKTNDDYFADVDDFVSADADDMVWRYSVSGCGHDDCIESI